ncbi:hypothetical protein BS78_05G084400 [Paspalum vaginatum]|nr:hypothetical protein BS78_05G084400 [Paspalum vaginatum]
MTSISSRQQDALLPHCLLVALLLATQLSCSLALGIHSNQTATPAPYCRPDQASALLRLKSSFSFSTDGWPGWGPFENGYMCTLASWSWRADTDCCRWEGVRCGDADGRVTTLDLGGCRLHSGGLHPALFDLTSLRHLNLAWNSFNGSQLPAVGFDRLTELLHLNLSNCGFGGPIPDAMFGRLTKLVSLDLSTEFVLMDDYDDFFSLGTWPDSILVEPNIASLLVNLSNLEELYLGTVDLSDNGPMWCSALANSTPQLKVLSLPCTGIYGPICEPLSRTLTLTLTEIDLQYNGLYGRIPEFFADSPSLNILRLNENFLEWIPSRIFQNKNLTTIDVTRNLKLSGSLPNNFSSDSMLTDLLVSGTNFSGPIPSSIGNLKSLNNLGLASTYYSQELPSSIGELRSLTSLQASGAGLRGGIPSWISNLTSLVHLQFSDCSLSGEVPSFLGDLKDLTRLQLYNCNFSGTLPPQMFNLTQLKFLYLQSNNLHGVVELSSFWKLPKLFWLSLSNNKLTVLADDEGNSSAINQMQTLLLEACNISKLPSALRHMRSIQHLDLSKNQIHGAIPHWAWEIWREMVFLDLSHNKFTRIEYGSHTLIDTGITVLSFNSLQGPIPIPGRHTKVLDFSNNQFSSIPLDFGSQFGDIDYFNARANNLSGKIPPSICAVTSSTTDLIDLSYNNLSGSIPSCLMEGTVNILTLKRNRLQGELPNNMIQSCAFMALDFSDNQIEGKLPRSLVACTSLEVFDIGNNHISDTFPCWMSKLPELQVLVLKSNKFVGQVGKPSIVGEKTRCEFIKLRILELSSNKFFGTLQDEWFMNMKSMATKSLNEIMSNKFTHLGQTYQLTDAITYKGNEEVLISTSLSTLVYIDVSDNAFHGAIPKSIGDLGLLNGVNLSHNALTGPIPPQFGALNQLESLDLSSNDLLGEIPEELASLNFLSILNLSYNELVGRIPDSPHFLTFTNLSFLGNIGLCGFQVSRPCSNTKPEYVELHHSEKKSVDLVLFLVTGLGFGFGFSIAIVLIWGIRVKRRSEDHIFSSWKKVFSFFN